MFYLYVIDLNSGSFYNPSSMRANYFPSIPQLYSRIPLSNLGSNKLTTCARFLQWLSVRL